jgi:hypothetical protein
MNFREHATKVVDCAIRVALVAIVAVPFWLCCWLGACGLTEAPEPGSSADVACRCVALPGFAFLAPGYAAIKLLRLIGISVGIDWLIGLLAVPAFWGTVFYSIAQLYRHVRISRKRV